MRTMIALVGAVACLSACQPNSSTQQTTQEPTAVSATQAVEKNKLSESERLNEWFAAMYEEQLQSSPIMLTFLGRKEKYDQINDMTEAFEKKQLNWQAKTVENLKNNFDYNKLSAEAKISYDIWIYQYEQAKAGAKFNTNGYIFTQFNGIQAFAAQFLINFHRVDEISDMQAYIKRIGGISIAIDQLLVRAKENAAAGTRPPKFAYEGVIEQSGNLITGIPFSDAEGAADSPLWMDVQRKINGLVDAEEITVEQARKLTADAKEQLLNNFLPSYQALIAWFESDIENTSSNPTGVSTQKNGQAFYDLSLIHISEPTRPY